MSTTNLEMRVRQLSDEQETCFRAAHAARLAGNEEERERWRSKLTPLDLEQQALLREAGEAFKKLLKIPENASDDQRVARRCRSSPTAPSSLAFGMM
jgi:hypothetical protein